jgi:glycerol transport system substrate-binding protein
MGRKLLASAALVGLLAPGAAWADIDAAERWIDEEFQPSALSREEQLEEMQWFIDAAEPFRGMEINVVAEAIPTHEYEAATLTRAFEEITGIRVNMQIMGEGDVVQAVQTQLQTGRNIYDMFVNDADLIGMHYRLGQTTNLTEWMEGAGADVTNPMLDLDDFFGLASATAPDGDLYQLPDQQFANLYWFRKDWFDREDLQEQFQEIYGYELGVPLNWSAYEDIAEFFSEHVQEIDGTRIYGHMDYGKRAPDLGWRMTDAWLSMAGAADIGLPNGVPVDEWGIRMEEGTCNPVGATVERGGATNSRAAVYAIEKWDEWLRNYAPPERPISTSTSRCPRSPRATSPSRSSGTPPSPPTWCSPRPRGTTPWTRTARRSGGWRPRPTAPTGRRGCSAATRTSAPGPSSR